MQPEWHTEVGKVKCYGSKAALCAEATFIKPEEEGSTDLGVPTINLEVAPRLDQGHIQWAQKIIVQLSVSELPLICALTLGYLPHLEIKRPGKGISIERQKDKLFVRASAGAGKLHVLPITIGDSYRLSALFLSRLQQQSALDATLLLAALRGSTALAQLP